MTEELEDEWCIECSDDELYNPGKLEPRVWRPLPEDIIKLYEEIAEKGTLKLEWQCPGRRRPIITHDKESEEDSEESDDSNQLPEKPPSPTEFDFDDSAVDIKMTPRRTPGGKPKGSAQKRVASLDKVMFDLLRHKRLEEQEKRESAQKADTSTKDDELANTEEAQKQDNQLPRPFKF